MTTIVTIRRSAISASGCTRPFQSCCSRLRSSRYAGRIPICRAQEDELEARMKADLDRIATMKQLGFGSKRVQEARKERAPGSPLDTAREAVDKVLIADFFFVLFIGAWLALGVVEKTTLDSSVLLDVWYPLWPMVFQPAIGVLMAGALTSGLVGWFNDNVLKS